MYRIYALLLCCGLAQVLMPSVAEANTIYKWVDKDGKVHFSDRPVEGAKKISGDDEPEADAETESSSGPFQRNQVIGRWQDEILEDIHETFTTNGDYIRAGEAMGMKTRITGTWKLLGDMLIIQVNAKTMTMPNGQQKTESKSDVRRRKLISFDDNVMHFSTKGKYGDDEFRYKRISN